MNRSLMYTITLCKVLQFVVASIAGVTYMDHFDFEQRYRDVNECNPLYWHPLHLPEKCVKIFEKLIRSRLQLLTPLRIFMNGSPLTAEQPALIYPNNYIYNPIYWDDYTPRIEYMRPVETRSLSPFEIMFELLRRDVRELPSAPSVGVSPYLGVVAMYKQPVSYKTVTMIKKLARAYADSGHFDTMQSKLDTSNMNQQEKKVKIAKKVINGTLVVDKLIKSNDAIALLKIKKIK